MNNFWETMMGLADGNQEKAFTKDFGLIPDGTKVFAKIDDFSITEKPANNFKGAQKFYEIKWGITQGDFMGRNIFQKIKCFDEDEKVRFKALNMLMLIMKLSGVTPPPNAPDMYMLRQMIGKVMGIKIKEWPMTKAESSITKGNFISEVHAPAGFAPVTGKKAEVVHDMRATPVVLQEDDMAF